MIGHTGTSSSQTGPEGARGRDKGRSTADGDGARFKRSIETAQGDPPLSSLKTLGPDSRTRYGPV